ncbi:hypothetical protein C2845_PM16G07700 [Panicum miliaceum]|uniref:Uncharacterized protein n=1 Tax=Panicum miliaceum TaxID=4540 RepID=A0A3L6PXN3_PANMI|nr:hypothetical protein C2845_PM16G07700 [Panicum miliaceum]
MRVLSMRCQPPRAVTNPRAPATTIGHTKSPHKGNGCSRSKLPVIVTGIPSQAAGREESPSAGCRYHNELVAGMRDQSLWCQSTGPQPTMPLPAPRGSPVQGLHDHAVDSPRKPPPSSPSSSCSEVGRHHGTVVALRLLLPHGCRLAATGAANPPARPAAGTAHPRACEAAAGTRQRRNAPPRPGPGAVRTRAAAAPSPAGASPPPSPRTRSGAATGSGRHNAGSVALGLRRRGAPPTQVSPLRRLRPLLRRRPERLLRLFSHAPGRAATGSGRRIAGSVALGLRRRGAPLTPASPHRRLKRPRLLASAEGRGRGPAAVFITSCMGFRRPARAAARREESLGEGAAARGYESPTP